GQVIAFESRANDLTDNSADTTYDDRQIFVRNVAEGTTTLASIDSAGSNGGNDASDTPVLSSDGSTVVFESYASDLTNDLDLDSGQYNVFAYNLSSNIVSLISIKAAGLFAANSTSESLSLSDNGQEAVFYSNASDLIAGISGGEVYGWAGNILTLLSVNSTGGAETSSVFDDPVLSGDGSTVAFTSYGNDLVGGNLNSDGYTQVYSRNWLAKTPTTTLISIDSAGTAAGDSYSGVDDNLSISDNGQVIAFESRANDLTDNSADTTYDDRQIFVRNVAEGTTTLASVDSAGSNGGNDASDTPTVSSNGSIVTFNSYASDLVAGVSASNNYTNVYYTPIGAAQFAVTATSPQTAGASFTITVTAEDAAGHVFTGYSGTVHFSSTDSKAVLPADTTLIDGTGTFTVTLKTAGTQTITATDTLDASLTGISNPIAVNPAAATKVVFVQQPSNTSVGESIAPAVKAAIEDQYGNIETGDNTDSVSMALGAGSPPGTLSGTTKQTVVDGVATFGNLSINQVGNAYTLAASSGTLTQATSNAFNITPLHLAFLQGPTDTTAGSTISPAVTVLIEDQNDNVITGDNSDEVTLALAPGSTSGGVLSGTLTEQVTDGEATFSDLSINQSGIYYLAASSPTNTSATGATSDYFYITPAGATQVVFTQTPSSGTAGQALSTVTAAIEDQFGNVETSDTTDKVTISVKTGPGSFTSGSTTTATVSDGIATFNNLVLDTAGTYTLSAASGSLTPGTSNSIVINPATPHLVFTAQPSSTTAGSTISTVTVELEDQFGNVETSDSTDKVSMALGAGSPSGTLNGTLTVTFNAGVATFSNLSIDQAGDGYTLTASSTVNSTNLSVTSNAFNITPAAAYKLAFLQQPMDTMAGNTIDPAVTVLIEDQYGNIETGDSTDKVSLSIGINPNNGVLNGTLTQTVSAGEATFSDLSIDQAGAGYALLANSQTNTKLTQATSNDFTITPAAAAQLVLTQQPTNTAAGAVITPAVKVAIEDKFGNVESNDSTDTVSIAIGANPGSGTLSGTTTQTVVDGVATFGNLSINNAGNGYTLAAGSNIGGQQLQVTSNTFNITSSGPTDITSDLKITSNGLTWNFVKKEYVQTLTLTNISTQTFDSGITLILKGLSSNASLANPTGYMNGNTDDPYVDINTPTGGFKPNTSITVTLYFNDPTETTPIGYTPDVLNGEL
ncbi:MAG TPA: hypothetical protein VMF69_26360, partial [Gemmataceae bacterium]|nr:hypothetical protein [Gemmataceae bacterium]